MAKKKKQSPSQKETTVWFHQLADGTQNKIAVAAILLFSFVYFWPLVFEGKEPPKSDIVAHRGAAHSIIEYNKAHLDRALWATNIFSGMPAISISIPPTVPGPQELISLLNSVVDWRALYVFLYGVITFFLLRFWGLKTLPALFGTFAFLMIPNYLGILEAGHNSKFKAMMIAPAVIFAFHYMIKNTSLWSFLLLALAFFIQGRTGHYQIIFYTAMVLFAIGIPYLVDYIREKQWDTVGKQLGVLAAAIAVGIFLIAPKFLLTNEFLPHSTRGAGGGNGDSGVGIDYAMQWSFDPAESITFLIPNFFGGSSSQEYTGDAVPQLKGRTIPGYWGNMPFTSTTQYIGIITMLLGILGLIVHWRKRLIFSLAVISFIALLLSFGRHFAVFYQFFYNYVPLFNKFRVPSMSLFILHFTFPVFAAFGLQAIAEFTKDRSEYFFKTTLALVGVFTLLAIGSVLMGETFGFVTQQDFQNYQSQVIDLLQRARMDIMHQDAWRLLIFTVIGGGFLLAFLKQYIGKGWLYTGLIAVLLVDMFTVDARYLDGFQKSGTRLDNIFRQTPVDAFLLQDSEHYRIFPLGQEFQSNRWAYYHQTIGGYRPAKLQSYQEILENALYQGWDQRLPVNWNVVRMLNVKYLIARQQLQHPDLKQAFTSDRQGLYVYQYDDYLPRVTLIDSIIIAEDKASAFSRLNSPDFNPATSVILEEMPELKITRGHEPPGSAVITEYGPNRIAVDVLANRNTMLLLSEIHLKEWWHAKVDGREIPIFRANRLLRALPVSAGEHRVEFYIDIPLYSASVWGARTIGLLFYLAIIGIAIRKTSMFSKIRKQFE